MRRSASSLERVQAALRGERVRPVPVGAVTQTATVSQMEELGIRWPEAHRDAGMLAGLAAGARTILGFDLVRVPFDQTVEVELLGGEVDFGDLASNCTLRRHPLEFGDPPPPLTDVDRGRARAVLEAIRLLRGRLGTEAAVVGGLVGPFTLACQLVGTTSLLMETILHPDLVQPYLDFAVEIGSRYAALQVEAGAHALCLEDMSASLELTSPCVYEKFILEAERRLIAAIEVPVILHICGGNTRILPFLARTGAAALSLDSKTDLGQAVAAHPGAVIGGVPAAAVLLEGTIDEVRQSSIECLAQGVHVLAPGCGIPPETPTQNLLEMARVAREWTP